MHNREGLSLRDILNSLYDYDLWPIYAVSRLRFADGFPLDSLPSARFDNLLGASNGQRLLFAHSQVSVSLGYLQLLAHTAKY